MSKYALAIDLGGTTAKCALIKNDQLVEKIIVESKIGQIIEHIFKEVSKELLEKNNVKSKELEFIGITICGIIDYENGSVLWSGNLQWNNYPVVEKIKDLFGVKNIFLLNDAKAATYAEYITNIRKNKKSMIMYTIGTGLGGSVVVDDKLHFGSNTKMASEPGHSGGFQNEYQCNCNLVGCIEGLSSASGIERAINQEISYFQDKLRTDKKVLTIKDVAKLFITNDETTVKIFEKCLTPLAQHIAVSLHLMDFEVVVIGGGPSALGQPLIDLLKTILKNYLLPSFYENLDLRLAILGNEAGFWGIYHWSKQNLK